jgi:hypothetical protein
LTAVTQSRRRRLTDELELTKRKRGATALESGKLDNDLKNKLIDTHTDAQREFFKTKTT